VIVADPVGSGFVASLPRPGRNTTGFINEEAATVGKRLELLKEIAPTVKRVAIIFDPDTAAGRGSYYLPAFEAAARALKVESIKAPIHGEAEIEGAITALGQEPGAGLVGMNDGSIFVHRAQIMSSAAAKSIPGVYYDPIFAREGGLLAYGPDRKDFFRRAATYVDRILRGARPVELPVQLPVKYEFVINLKTAKALGLDISPALLSVADELIE
jgi:putative ABC transport system substrate-binding protein